jgi:hypothetical protein
MEFGVEGSYMHHWLVVWEFGSLFNGDIGMLRESLGV